MKIQTVRLPSGMEIEETVLLRFAAGFATTVEIDAISTLPEQDIRYISNEWMTFTVENP